ncbi:nucleoporin SEH1 [Marmota marmota marmota]|uniref:nucleoporin SEH1 n=1 Tax=Marmota marmota marmota TaxID=9994 RepID=UPI000762537F|nr:nucleoporin SEH1 [Marmota marmota marmota]
MLECGRNRGTFASQNRQLRQLQSQWHWESLAACSGVDSDSGHCSFTQLWLPQQYQQQQLQEPQLLRACSRHLPEAGSVSRPSRGRGPRDGGVARGGPAWGEVWDKSESGDWHCTASWKTHSGSVWRVTWAHPEFGQVLASCSFDRTAAVWEEIVGESNDKLRGQSHWVKRTTLVDSRTSVTDVKFAPKHMGLMLATCSADGIVRIYEAPDVMNLSQWSLQHEISCKLSCSCISWNPSSSRAHSPMIAVGSDDSSPNAMAKVQIFEYNENTRKYAKAETLMTVTDPVHDIAFAPNLGRSFHILAIATKDVRIFTLKPVRKELTSSGGPTKFEIHIVAQFDNHNSQVWRVSWNITGTVLASSGDDGCVRLWKANYMDNWKCTGILKGNGSPVNGSSQQGNSNPSLGSNIPSLQNSLNGSSASR